MKCLVFGLALFFCFASVAKAFEVRSGFTEGCHEAASVEAFQSFLETITLPDDFDPPIGSVERKLAAEMARELGFAGELDERERFLLFSLVVGVRAPDTDGHATTNIEKLRSIHGDPRPEGQYAHALRGREDDFEEGAERAVQGTRDVIASLFEEAALASGGPMSEQVLRANVTLDFYDTFDVTVWANTFLIGQAIHALQDSFAHTIRTKDSGYQDIGEVLNYVDAIARGHDESVDGLAHSSSADDCNDPRSRELLTKASEASLELMNAFLLRIQNQDKDALNQVLDRWMRYRPGCTLSNNFCDSTEQLDLIREEQTKPYLRAIFSCSSASSESSFAVAFGLLVYLVRRRNRALS